MRDALGNWWGLCYSQHGLASRRGLPDECFAPVGYAGPVVIDTEPGCSFNLLCGWPGVSPLLRDWTIAFAGAAFRWMCGNQRGF
jgi:hypothetical protein